MKHLREKKNDTTSSTISLPELLLAVVTLVLVIAISDVWASGYHRRYDRDEIPFADAEIYFELNNTDGDLGIHALIDGEPWKKLEIEDPRERQMLNIRVKGRLRGQGLTELFFESAEPSFNELTPEEFFNRFPEGEYEIEGITLEGDELESTAWVSHVLAAPPGNITVNGAEAAENCDQDPLPSVSGAILIDWDPVTESHPEIGKVGEIEVEKYQLVLERLVGTPLSFTVDLSPDVTEFEVPAGLTSPGDQIKFEILAREATGNQTAVESCFDVN